MNKIKTGLPLRQVTLEPRKQTEDQLCTFRLGVEPVGDVRSALSLGAARRWRDQAGACYGVLSQCSHLSFECSGVLSHVCGHVTRVGKKKDKPINECWNMLIFVALCFVFTFIHIYRQLFGRTPNVLMPKGTACTFYIFVALLCNIVNSLEGAPAGLKQIHAFDCMNMTPTVIICSVPTLYKKNLIQQSPVW